MAIQSADVVTQIVLCISIFNNAHLYFNDCMLPAAE